jgi:hypothetical protein
MFGGNIPYYYRHIAFYRLKCRMGGHPHSHNKSRTLPDIANDKNDPSFQRFYPGIMHKQTAPAENCFTSAPSGGIVMIKPDSSASI